MTCHDTFFHQRKGKNLGFFRQLWLYQQALAAYIAIGKPCAHNRNRAVGGFRQAGDVVIRLKAGYIDGNDIRIIQSKKQIVGKLLTV